MYELLVVVCVLLCACCCVRVVVCVLLCACCVRVIVACCCVRVIVNVRMNRFKLGVAVQNILSLAPGICALLSDSFSFKKNFIFCLGICFRVSWCVSYKYVNFRKTTQCQIPAHSILHSQKPFLTTCCEISISSYLFPFAERVLVYL